MKMRYSKICLLLLIALGVSACGKSFEGSWVIDQETTVKDCLLAMNSESENEGEENNAMAEMAESFAVKMCDGLVQSMSSELNINDNVMTFNALGKEIKCTIDSKANTFLCDGEAGNDEPGSISIIGDKLVLQEASPKEGEESMKFTYDKG